jgi:hypothetical protein
MVANRVVMAAAGNLAKMVHLVVWMVADWVVETTKMVEKVNSCRMVMGNRMVLIMERRAMMAMRVMRDN